MKTRLLTALTATTLLAVPAAASAQGAAPTPGCQGIQLTDKAGDSTNRLATTAGAPAQPGSPSSDLVAGWLTYDGSKAFANIQVDNLTKGEVDEPYVAIGWEMMMTTSAGERYVRAYQDRAGMVKYTWGAPSSPTAPEVDRIGGDTTGTVFPGKNGVVQIELPLAEADFGAKPGSTLKGLAMEVRQWASLPAAVPSTGLPLVYPAPIYDDAVGKVPFTLTPCAAGAAPGPGAPGGPPAPAPAPVPSPAPGSNSGGQASQGLDVNVTVPKLSAKKLKKAKKFTVKLSGNATGLTAAVRTSLTGGKVLAKGKLATLKGTGKLTLKGKKLKKGTYVLVFSGKNAQGQTGQGAVKIKIKK